MFVTQIPTVIHCCGVRCKNRSRTLNSTSCHTWLLVDFFVVKVPIKNKDGRFTNLMNLPLALSHLHSLMSKQRFTCNNKCCVFRPENDGKHFKLWKSTFFIMRTRGSWRKTKKKVCWSAIESESQKLVDTQTLVAHLEFCSFLFFFLHEPLMCMTQNVLWIIPNEQPAFGSHSQSLTNKLYSLFFFMSLTCASRMHDGKGTFSWFSNSFHHFRPCKHMRKHAFAGRNTQQIFYSGVGNLS